MSNQRNILKNELADRLMPKPTNTTVRLENGDTAVSMQLMKNWVEHYSWQTKKIASILKGATLEETSLKIKSFLYNHIQYKIDESVQLLRNPARAWHDRYKGVDCKSYSIFASCILTNLGIKHAFRRIKQPYVRPNEYSHVYVVFPKNQQKPNYNNVWVIDGTIPFNSEPTFTQKNDLIMNLKHEGLAGCCKGLNYTEISYTVKSGDSLSRISKKTGVSVSSLKTANNLSSSIIYPNQKLVIPTGTTTNLATPPLVNNGSNSFGNILNTLVTGGSSIYGSILTNKNESKKAQAALEQAKALQLQTASSLEEKRLELQMLEQQGENITKAEESRRESLRQELALKEKAKRSKLARTGAIVGGGILVLGIAFGAYSFYKNKKNKTAA